MGLKWMIKWAIKRRIKRRIDWMISWMINTVRCVELEVAAKVNKMKLNE